MNNRDFLNNLREMSQEELQEKLDLLYNELFRMRFSAVSEQNDNTSGVRSKRKDIARVLTVINARTRGLEKQVGA